MKNILFSFRMLSNHVYNLMMQLTEESKSLQRIKNEYLRDAQGHDDCVAFWEKMVGDKEEHVKELTGLIKTHIS